MLQSGSALLPTKACNGIDVQRATKLVKGGQCSGTIMSLLNKLVTLCCKVDCM